MPFLGGRGQASRGYFGAATTPNAPTALVSTKGNGQISVAFTAPSFDGGLPITTYQYALSTDSYATFTTRATGTTASPLVITGLTNGTSYGVKIRAVNSLGNGLTSDAATAVIPSTVPNAPTSVSGTPNGETTSTVTWTAPANTGNPRPDGGSAITGYKVEYALSPYSSYTVFNANTGTTATSISVTGLNNGGSYKFRVSATNLNGFGATAESDVVVTNIVPGAPTIGTMTLSTTNTTDSLAWTAPAANGGSAITGYVYQTTTDSGSTFTTAVATGSTSTSKTFDPGYTNVTTKVRVAAVNSLGTPGPYSAISTVGYGGWTSGSTAVAHPTACPVPACSCDAVACACDPCPNGCGTATSSKTPTATHSGQTNTRTCYRWTRGDQATGYIYNQNTTAACDSAYTGCTGGSCGSCTGGTCSECTGCVGRTNVTASGTYDYPGHGSQAFTYVTDGFTGSGYMYMNNDPQGIIVHGTNCGGPSNGNYYVYNRYYCSASNTYTVEAYGCVDTIFAK